MPRPFGGADVGDQVVADDHRLIHRQAGDLGGGLEQARLGLADDEIRLATAATATAATIEPAPALRPSSVGYIGSRFVATKRAPRRTAVAAMLSRT